MDSNLFHINRLKWLGVVTWDRTTIVVLECHISGTLFRTVCLAEQKPATKRNNTLCF